MFDSMLGFILALAIGVGISYVNYRLTNRAATNPDERFAGVSLLRQALNLGFLAAVFFGAPYTPWDRTWMLVGAVIGLTVPTFLFTFLLLRRLNHPTADDSQNKGGESEWENPPK